MPLPYSRSSMSRKLSSPSLYLCVMWETACDLMRMLGEAGQLVAERTLTRRGSDQVLLLREADRGPRPMPWTQLREYACVAKLVEVRGVIERRHRGNADDDREARRAGDAEEVCPE